MLLRMVASVACSSIHRAEELRHRPSSMGGAAGMALCLLLLALLSWPGDAITTPCTEYNDLHSMGNGNCLECTAIQFAKQVLACCVRFDQRPADQLTVHRPRTHPSSCRLEHETGRSSL